MTPVKLEIGTIYQTAGSDYICIAQEGDAYILKRTTDNWTLTAHGCRFEDGLLYWGGSSRGHFPKP